MLDKEKVLKGLDICSSGFCKKECPYYREEHCSRTIMADAYTLLIEQEEKSEKAAEEGD